MPRIPLKQPSAKREEERIPFAPTRPFDFEPIIKFSESLAEMGRKIRDAEEAIFVERLKGEIDTALKDESLKIRDNPDFSAHGVLAKDSIKSVEAQTRSKITSLTPGSQRAIEEHLIRASTRFSIDITQRSHELRNDKLLGEIDIREDELILKASSASTPAQIQGLLDEHNALMTVARSVNALSEKQAVEKSIKARDKVLTESGLGMIDRSTTDFRLALSQGFFERLDAKSRNTLVGIANERDNKQETFDKGFRKQVKDIHLSVLREGAYLGKLNFGYMNTLLGAQRITFNESEELQRINREAPLSGGRGVETIELIRIQTLNALAALRPGVDPSSILDTASRAYNELAAQGVSSKELIVALKELVSLRRRDVLDLLREIGTTPMFPETLGDIEKILLEGIIRRARQGDVPGARQEWRDLKSKGKPTEEQKRSDTTRGFIKKEK
jgi:hypothetical protein